MSSNVGFTVHGLAHPAPLMVVVYAVLLPASSWRVGRMVKLTRRVNASVTDWLQCLVEGTVELPEVGRCLQAGQMYGEIAFFAPDRRRSLSARCATPCQLMSIDEDSFRQLLYQYPDFGLAVVRLIAGRMSNDVMRRAARGPRDGGDAPLAS